MAEYIGVSTHERAVRPRKSARSRAWERWTGPSPFPALTTRPLADRRWESNHLLTLQACDVVVALVAAVLTYGGRFGNTWTTDAVLLLAVPVVWHLALRLNGAYRVSVVGVGSAEYRSVLRAAVATFCGVAIASYLFNAQLARLFVVPLVILLPLGSVLVHWLFRSRLYSFRKRGVALRSTVVLGRADSCAAMIREIQSAPGAGYRVVAACVVDSDDVPAGSTIGSVPVVGGVEDTLDAVDTYEADVVAVGSHPDLAGQHLRRLGWALAERQVDLVISPGIMEVAGPRLSLRPAAGLSLLHVERPADTAARLFAKRVMDFVLALAITMTALPAMLVVATLIKLESRGPVFFLQERVGTHGRRFKMIKFRSMVVDADAQVSQVAGGHVTNKVLFKVKDDPRVTRIGKVIRRLSIDELPQLINVIMGDMSLVGPRPPLPREVSQYEDDAMQRLRVRPGMTGLWQVSGRSDLDWEQSLRLDLWYVDNWSVMLDLQILARTARAVFGGSGAY